jgi:hypothetical protein
MKFNDPREVDQVTYEMRLADYPRGLNRARINELLNGWPPYSEQEVQENQIEINVNSLEGTRIAHDGRSQFYQAFLKPGNYFKATTDSGPVHKRQKYNTAFTKLVNRPMKLSLDYFECMRSRFALDVAHGIGPAAWPNGDAWCPDAVGIEDMLIPANTLLTMKNLPFFAVYRSYTAPELIRLTKLTSKADPAWNMKLVDACLEWIDRETQALMGNNWPEVWAPEKASERVKGDGGFYAGDQVPTIDTFDFYFLDLDHEEPGWRRRIILDSWSAPAGPPKHITISRKSGAPYDDGKNQFLYDSGDRCFAKKREELMSFQFADLSAVAPFRYHSVRSLGFLLYAVCHIQNRLRCKFNECVFEALMMYFRVKSMEDVQRGLKLNLINKGFIDESFQFIPAAERFQVNAGLVELGLKENASLISANSSSYTPTQNYSQGGVEKTKFQVMAESSTVTSLISAGLTQAYKYQQFEYREIVRRFCRPNSQDHDVRVFRAAALKAGIPEKLLVPEAWEIEPERVMGAGNKTMEMAIAEWLMANREKYDPEPQREILRNVTTAVTDDPAMADRLVPEIPHISSSIHDAQLSIGSLMTGAPMAIKSGVNREETVAALLVSMQAIVQRIEQTGGVGTKEEIIGLQNVAKHIAENIQSLATDPTMKQKVKQFGDALGKIMNMVKAFAQRLQQQMQAAAQKNGQGDPKDAAKVQAMMMQAKVKADNAKESHAQKTAQRQLTFEQQTKQDAERHRMEMVKEAAEAAQDMRLARLKSTSED